MGKKLLTFALCLFLGMSVTLAQNRIITGTVTGAEDGFPIPGAAVFVEGTNIGTVTDVDGKYSLNVRKGTVLKVTFFGMKDAVISIGTENVINIVLSIDAVGLDEVVVTATGMTRQEKTLGYASTTVRSDELTKGRSPMSSPDWQERLPVCRFHPQEPQEHPRKSLSEVIHPSQAMRHCTSSTVCLSQTAQWEPTN